jgi:hypothetical protein
MLCSDREYFTRRQAEEEILSQSASTQGAQIHRLLATEYARRVALIEQADNGLVRRKTARRGNAFGEAGRA